VATEPSILTSGLFERAENVRRTVLRLVLILLATTLLAYPFARHLLHFIQQPLGARLVIYAPLEGLLGYIKVSLAAGVLLTSPLLLYEVKRFLQHVCRLPPPVAMGGMVASGGLFLLGVSFCYVAILPVTFGFLLSYGGENITSGISVSKYLSLTLGLTATCGAIFELPLVVLILHRLGLISIAFLTQHRRYAVLIATVLTAVLTPTPDAFTMTMLLVPLLGLYEGSILLLRFIEHREAQRTKS
jgi:sec-independent protein translocase protein TatC